MADITTKPRTKTKTKVKTERPRLHKVILVNDDYTPREFVVAILKAEFRMGEDRAYAVMMTAHRKGVCVVAVFTKDVAETKATRATDAGRAKGYPLLFTTEPEEYGVSSKRPMPPPSGVLSRSRSGRASDLRPRS
jgi:ATP-dependent Clp protease adaptor protein ClpS